MGIRVFHNREFMERQGFYKVITRRLLRSWVSGENEIEDWCLATLQDEFSVGLYLGREGIVGHFRSESDATLFALRWS